MKLPNLTNSLIDAVYSNKGLQHIIDTARDALGHEILVLDSSFKIMALSYDIKALGKFPKDIMVGQYLDSSTIKFIQNNNILSKTRNNGASHYIKKLDPLDGTLVTLIHIEGIEVGELIIFEMGKKFQDIDFEVAKSLSKLLSIELQKTNFFNINKDFMSNYMLTDLIEKSFISEDIIYKRFHHLELLKSKTFYIMVITNKQLQSFDSKIPFIIQSLKFFIPLNNSIVYKSSLVSFIDESMADNLFNNKNLGFKEYLSTNSLYAGISLKFSTLSTSRKYYLQALKANEIGQLQNIHISHYEKCTKYIIANLISTQYDWQDFCHPAILLLEKKDKEEGSNLLETLKYYIYFTNSPNDAAKTLCIHRNTLFYRINKIKQICHITLNNADEILYIYYSIKLLEFNNKYLC